MPSRRAFAQVSFGKRFLASWKTPTNPCSTLFTLFRELVSNRFVVRKEKLYRVEMYAPRHGHVLAYSGFVPLALFIAEWKCGKTYFFAFLTHFGTINSHIPLHHS